MAKRTVGDVVWHSGPGCWTALVNGHDCTVLRGGVDGRMWVGMVGSAHPADCGHRLLLSCMARTAAHAQRAPR